MGAGASALDENGDNSTSSPGHTGTGTSIGRAKIDYDSASDEQKALMAQAQAHWHRMIRYTPMGCIILGRLYPLQPSLLMMTIIIMLTQAR